MARYKIPERSFVFEMPDGSEIPGYPLTIAHERAFLRDGTAAVIGAPREHTPEQIYGASVRYIAAALRKPEEFIEETFTPAQAAQVLEAVLRESLPPAEGSRPGASSP